MSSIIKYHRDCNPTIASLTLVLLLLALLLPLTTHAQDFTPDTRLQPSPPLREFRGVWVATVYNIDWPSRPGLTAAQQQGEMIAILNRAAALHLNAVIFQVRPMADAFYKSRIEPWSHYLSGEMGKSPGYDPLAFAVYEAHRRGLELHAWFNPYRAKTGSKMSLHKKHVSRSQKSVIRKAGKGLWMDPSSDFTRERMITVVMDVVKRYDVDGIHIDDYFYPYPEAGGGAAFNDSANWNAYQKNGGQLKRADWRRDHVNRLVRELYASIKRAKPQVKFGVSPFGIWKPGYPSTVEGRLDAHGQLYADSRRWLHEGWLDYISPQLYWQTQGPQSFTSLYNWWQSENSKGRHLWPGIAISRIGRKGSGEGDGRSASEILTQINTTRNNRGSSPGTGHIFWNEKALRRNAGKIQQSLLQSSYSERALVPASPWLGNGKGMPQAVVTQARLNGDRISLKWYPEGKRASSVRWWVIQVLEGKHWRIASTLPSAATGIDVINAKNITAISIRPVDAAGGVGRAIALRK
ncbi:MAG: family 10 glycosylhydrolase [Verrucomicrobiales bacterium]|nr:family 10 glycosylhydrolase [Verrucomicrobiales bacterium]